MLTLPYHIFYVRIHEDARLISDHLPDLTFLLGCPVGVSYLTQPKSNSWSSSTMCFSLSHLCNSNSPAQAKHLRTILAFLSLSHFACNQLSNSVVFTFSIHPESGHFSLPFLVWKIPQTLSLVSVLLHVVPLHLYLTQLPEWSFKICQVVTLLCSKSSYDFLSYWKEEPKTSTSSSPQLPISDLMSS